MFLCVAGQCVSTVAIAGPPFQTDDPEPVDYHHWEFYLASIQEYLSNETDLTLPHIEINYGAIPNLQLHLLAPMEYLNGMDGPKYGYSSTELGIKYRFLNDTDHKLEVGIFPLAELPTGDRSDGLNSGSTQVYLPLWIQKNWEKFSTYGGAGYWLNPGAGNKNWIFAGWELQYDISDAVTVGGEVFYHTPESLGASSSAGFNIGGFINLDDHDHILYSVGHSITGDASTTVYIGYQYTI
ncbi:MAG TPA: hypothetical protein VGM92_14465 [Candidatus Kapabacteria bacterium]